MPPEDLFVKYRSP